MRAVRRGGSRRIKPRGCAGIDCGVVVRNGLLERCRRHPELPGQSGKIGRSGLKDYFSAIEIVAEKDAATYRALLEKYALVPGETWMVGNSPKSDINPALAAGLNAVFVPHAETWVLENGDLAPAPGPGRLLVLERSADLRSHF